MAAVLDKEDGFIQECTPLYPWREKLEEPLEATHTVRRIFTEPQTLGYPTNRPRSYCIGVSNRSLVWVGPSQADVQQDFLSIFGRQRIANADVYLNADDNEINEELRQFAVRQRNFWPPNYDAAEAIRQGADILAECLFPGAYNRMLSWELQRVRKGLADQVFLADCDHNANKGPAAGPCYPTELSHSCVIAHHLKRPATKWETLSSHGWHTHASVAGAYGVSPMIGLLKSANLKDRELASLGGNGMHIPTVWAVYMYMLMNTVWRSDVTPSVSEVKLGQRGGTVFFEEFTETQVDEEECEDME